MRPKTQDGRRASTVQLMFGLDTAVLYGDAKNKHNGRYKQKSFVATKLQTLRKMSPNLYSEIVVQPALQYFLAMVCDLKVDPGERIRLGLRYANTPEVQKLLAKLKRKQYVTSELTNIDANAIITTLKEILSTFPGGIFDDHSEEFICVSPESPLHTALIYVNGLILQLPYFLRQFTYLICRSLKNLIQQSAGSTTDAYTDALLLFTPTLFPNSVRDVGRFLRAARISLILIDLCDFVFRPFLAFTSYPNTNDEDFFHDVLDSLTYLCDWLNSKENDGEAVERTENNGPNIFNDNDDDMFCSMSKLPDATNYYQITYLADYE